MDGVTLAAAWSRLDADARRRAITQLGEALAELHGHTFTPTVRTALRMARPVGDVSPAAVIGADINPLPVPRARLLLEPAALMTGVDRGLIDQVTSRFDELEPIDPCGERALAEPNGAAVVHGDAHPLNVLWDDGVVAVLDWEWVRVAAVELEIEPFLYRGYESKPSLVADSQRIIGWLADANPSLFASPDLVRCRSAGNCIRSAAGPDRPSSPASRLLGAVTRHCTPAGPSRPCAADHRPPRRNDSLARGGPDVARRTTRPRVFPSRTVHGGRRNADFDPTRSNFACSAPAS